MGEENMIEHEMEAYRIGYNKGQVSGAQATEEQYRGALYKLKEEVVRLEDKERELNDVIHTRGVYIERLKAQKTATNSLLKIAHNDITAFLACEDRMKKEILTLEVDKKLLKGELNRLKGVTGPRFAVPC